VSLDTISCIIQKFFGRIAALLCGVPYYSNSILDCVGE
jgi:hypothetical protein